MSLQKQLNEYERKHRSNGVLLDTNLLLLYVFFHFSRDYIGKDRLQVFDLESADLLMEYLSKFEKIITTEHVLAETSNLTRQMVRGKKWTDMGQSIFPLFCLDEKTSLKSILVSRSAIQPIDFVSLGLTDSALVASSSDHLLITADLDLYCKVCSKGGDAINFTHMREAYGLL